MATELSQAFDQPQAGGHAAASSLGAATLESRPLGTSQHPSFGEAIGGPGSMTNTITSLSVVVALIIVLGVVFKAISAKSNGLSSKIGAGGRSPAGILSVLGRYPLGRNQTLVLLQVDRRILLLCQTATGKMGRGASMHTLCEMTDPDEVASILNKASGDSPGFDAMLSGFEAPSTSEFGEDVEVVDLTRRRGRWYESWLGRGGPA
ncbi:MAG TPA: hypothetical protein ENJ00_11215 [Phycisphaerales bacterium]|nr:hypothetical protein [Phycisphaerales bacterium]